MAKYIDADKLKKSIGNYAEGAHAALNALDGDADYYKGKIDACKDIQKYIASLQHEQPMPNSTHLIELWHADKEMLKEKDFRGDPWRLAYNAFMCGFGRGLAVNKLAQPDVDLQKIINQTYHDGSVADTDEIDHVAYENIARHFYELGLNARKEESK